MSEFESYQAGKLFDLSGRVAIVTGGSRGIGRAMALAFAANGAKVVIASRKGEACEAVAREIEAAGGEALAVPTHVGEIADLEQLVARTVERFGAIDIVVNNAANALAQPLGKITPEAWDKSHHANLRAPLFLVQAALPYLEKSGRASVINLVSVGAFMFAGGLTLYTTAKAGLLQLTRTLAAELAGRGIRVNAIAPGAIDTDMMRANPQAAQDAMAKASLLRRMGRADELVGIALYLASDASSFATGQCFFVDGGTVPAR